MTPATHRTAADRPRDWTDGHVERWRPVLPHLDPDVEGAVTRMSKLTRHLGRVREQGVADYGLQKHEFDTLHGLAAAAAGPPRPSCAATSAWRPPR